MTHRLQRSGLHCLWLHRRVACLKRCSVNYSCIAHLTHFKHSGYISPSHNCCLENWHVSYTTPQTDWFEAQGQLFCGSLTLESQSWYPKHSVKITTLPSHTLLNTAPLQTSLLLAKEMPINAIQDHICHQKNPSEALARWLKIKVPY